jgi:hypothetical protein
MNVWKEGRVRCISASCELWRCSFNKGIPYLCSIVHFRSLSCAPLYFLSNLMVYAHYCDLYLALIAT